MGHKALQGFDLGSSPCFDASRAESAPRSGLWSLLGELGSWEADAASWVVFIPAVSFEVANHWPWHCSD